MLLRKELVGREPTGAEIDTAMSERKKECDGITSEEIKQAYFQGKEVCAPMWIPEHNRIPSNYNGNAHVAEDGNLDDEMHWLRQRVAARIDLEVYPELKPSKGQT